MTIVVSEKNVGPLLIGDVPAIDDDHPLLRPLFEVWLKVRHVGERAVSQRRNEGLGTMTLKYSDVVCTSPTDWALAEIDSLNRKRTNKPQYELTGVYIPRSVPRYPHAWQPNGERGGVQCLICPSCQVTSKIIDGLVVLDRRFTSKRSVSMYLCCMRAATRMRWRELTKGSLTDGARALDYGPEPL